MSIFLDTRGRSTLGIAVCARCGIKMSREDLSPDPNAPGLMCCKDDLDVLDPWRLAPRETENITMEWCRPDFAIDGQGPMPIYANQFYGVRAILPNVPWAPLAPYVKGASVTPKNVNLSTTTLPQYQFVAISGGISGAQPPVWPTDAGVVVLDASVTWLCLGIYPN